MFAYRTQHRSGACLRSLPKSLLRPAPRTPAGRAAFTSGVALRPFRYRKSPTHIMRVTLETPGQPEGIALIDELDAYQRPLYPMESHHGIGVEALCRPNVLFAVARDEAGRAVACGAIVLENDYGELKRMFTLPVLSGRGIAGRLLQYLETEAASRGSAWFMLETGHLQSEAIGLYARFGYERPEPFGSYVEDPNSVFMQKHAACVPV